MSPDAFEPVRLGDGALLILDDGIIAMRPSEPKCDGCGSPLITARNVATGRLTDICFLCFAMGRVEWPR